MVLVWLWWVARRVEEAREAYTGLVVFPGGVSLLCPITLFPQYGIESMLSGGQTSTLLAYLGERGENKASMQVCVLTRVLDGIRRASSSLCIGPSHLRPCKRPISHPFPVLTGMSRKPRTVPYNLCHLRL